jgi:hypothetical protein
MEKKHTIHGEKAYHSWRFPRLKTPSRLSRLSRSLDIGGIFEMPPYQDKTKRNRAKTET